ncbi:MAG: trigger factor [Candidatus Aminicenantes bacterium]
MVHIIKGTHHKINKINDIKRELEIEIPAGQAKNEYERVLNNYVMQADIKGFRQGAAPSHLVKQKYESDIIQAVVQNLAPKEINDILKEENIQPVDSPVIKDIDFQEGKPLKLKVEFELWPALDLPPYKKIKIKKEKTEVSEEDVNRSLNELREKSARYEPVEERGVEDEDYVMVELKGREKETKRFLPTQKTPVIAGHPDNDPVLNKNIAGLKTGEEADFEITHKKDTPNKRVAGKTIEYNLKVQSIKKKKLPELDDDFAKEIGKFDNLQALKDEIKKELQTARKNISERKITEEILEKIAGETKVELPETVVNQEMIANLRQAASQMPQQSLEEKQVESLKKEARIRAEKTIKNHLILKKIAEKENIQVTEDDLQKEFQSIAEKNNVPLPKVVEYMNQEGRKENLKENLLLRRTVDFLTEQAIIE